MKLYALCVTFPYTFTILHFHKFLKRLFLVLEYHGIVKYWKISKWENLTND